MRVAPDGQLLPFAGDRFAALLCAAIAAHGGALRFDKRRKPDSECRKFCKVTGYGPKTAARCLFELFGL